jgi:hypothetical protein
MKPTIIMKTFYGDDGNFTELPLETVLERMSDDWIDDEITSVNISELRDACKLLLKLCDAYYGKKRPYNTE